MKKEHTPNTKNKKESISQNQWMQKKRKPNTKNETESIKQNQRMKKEHKLNTKTGSEAQTKYKEWKSSLIQQRSIYRNLKTQKEIQNKLYLEK